MKYIVSYWWARGDLDDPIKVFAEEHVEAESEKEAISYYRQYICDETDKSEWNIEITDDEIFCTSIEDEDDIQCYSHFEAEKKPDLKSIFVDYWKLMELN